MTERTSYWWECEQCHHDCDFSAGCGEKLGKFFWSLLKSGWDQSLLSRDCPKCKQKTFRITYDFPSKQPERLSVQHIVGLDMETWLPMLWETRPAGDPGERWFDIKYVNRNSAFGLNRPAVLTQDGLRKLFGVYAAKVSNAPFP